MANNLLIEAKEYAYELLKIKSKDLLCYLYLVDIYTKLNKPLKAQNLIQKIDDEISYYKSKQTKYYKNQLIKYKEFLVENPLAFNNIILNQLKELID